MSKASRIGLIGCVKQKRELASPAKDLYVSPLFRGRRAAVERSCGRWFILSALHGLVLPDAMLAPYDLALKNVKTAERRVWSARVLDALRSELGPLEGRVFEVHAGLEYRAFGLERGLKEAGAEVETPMEGVPMGKQLRAYKAARS